MGSRVVRFFGKDYLWVKKPQGLCLVHDPMVAWLEAGRRRRQLKLDVDTFFNNASIHRGDMEAADQRRRELTRQSTLYMDSRPGSLRDWKPADWDLPQ